MCLITSASGLIALGRGGLVDSIYVAVTFGEKWCVLGSQFESRLHLRVPALEALTTQIIDTSSVVTLYPTFPCRASPTKTLFSGRL